jgi:hypothetical protein
MFWETGGTLECVERRNCDFDDLSSIMVAKGKGKLFILETIVKGMARSAGTCLVWGLLRNGDQARWRKKTCRIEQ